MVEPPIPEVMNVSEVAEYLRVAPATIYRLAQKGQIPCGRVGRTWRFHKEAIDRWIATHKEFSPDLAAGSSNA
jgi:excisionase family DNA binding protein